MPKLHVNGTTLEYRAQGSGQPLVLVHGSASDYRTWRGQRRAFAARYHVVAYSRRYHWPNAAIPTGADYSMNEHLDDLQALLHALQIEPAHLVGHSYGAFLALLLAMRQPGLVRTLVLAEPPVLTLFVSNTPRPMEILKLWVTRPRTAVAIVKFGAVGFAPARAAAKRGDLEAAMHVFGNAVLGRDAYRRLSGPRLEEVHANAFQAEFLGSGFLPLDADQIRRVQAPTLLITAPHSPQLFACLTQRLAELLPDAQRLEIAGASHLMHEDNPPAYNDAVLSFLANHPQAGHAPDSQKFEPRASEGSRPQLR
jgi:non-heme chloroperoxidase